MILGIKYCGGCNPRYDRVAAVREMERSLKAYDIHIRAYQTGGEYDACLLVKGCTRCVSMEKEMAGCGCLYIASAQEDFCSIRERLTERM